jgi:hypothetical protein
MEGQVVIENPVAVWAGLFDTMLDAWQLPLTNVGPVGEEQGGRGGKYPLPPSNYAGAVPETAIGISI